MTQAMTTKGASWVPARAVSFFPLWCKGSKHTREHQVKASISLQQDQDQLSRPICDPIQKELEGPTKDRPAY